MQRKINIKSLLIAIVSFIAVLALFYANLIVYSKIKFLSGEIGSATRSIVVLDEKRKEFELAKSNLEKQQENIEVVESAFFSEKHFVDLLNSLEDVSRKAGTGFEAKGAKLPEPGGEAQISFEVLGDFNSIAKFLVLLDNLRYSGMVNKLSLSPESEKSKKLIAKVDYFIFNFKK